MADYLTYEVEDFVVDDFFIAWVLDEDKYARYFWERWIEEHPHQKDVIMRAYSIVEEIQMVPRAYLTDAEIEEIHQNVTQRIAQTRGQSGLRYLLLTSKRWLSVAAVVILVLTGGTVVYFKSRLADPLLTVRNAVPAFINKQNKGIKPILVRLPDRSSVVLKPGSTLRYPSSFSEKKRGVELKGEAFFEIEHDPRRPFIVRTGELTTLVLGTSFKVRAFAGDSDFRVVVTSGKVAVSSAYDRKVNRMEKPKTVTLVANEALVYVRKDTSFTKEKLNKPLVLSPQVSKDLFRFHNVPFAEVIQKLRDVYGVEILFDQTTLGKCSISASLSNQSLYEKVQLICEAVNARFKVTETNITIVGEGCSGNLIKNNTNP